MFCGVLRNTNNLDIKHSLDSHHLVLKVSRLVRIYYLLWLYNGMDITIKTLK